MIEAIARCITDAAEVADSASPKLYDLRRHVRVSHDRLMTRLQRYLTDASTASKLQDSVITQRDGRYVIPLRAEFKGQVKAIVHDQSSTGATLFVEPLAVVELNNALREAVIAERDETRRVLAELSAQVGELAGEIVPGVAALAELDLAFAKAKYADAIRANEPVLRSGQQSAIGTSAVRGQRQQSASNPLLNARHPLLDPETVVPINIDPLPGTFAVVITGPNTGGKTVTLKTVGLLAAMAQSGLHIPAQSGSELPCFAAIYADIGDEQSIEQSLSTFSGHITNIVQLLKKADKHSLVILDELGAGTDPQEGRGTGTRHPLGPARARHHHLRGHPLPGVEDLCAYHPGRGQRFAGIQRADPAPDLQIDPGTAGSFECPGHRPAPGTAAGNHRGGPQRDQPGRSARR